MNARTLRLRDSRGSPRRVVDMHAMDEQRSLAQLSRYARVLDASIGIPGTRWRIGVDPLVGLIPGIGDWLGVGFSAWIVWQARRLGVRRSTLWRMLANLGLEATVGAIPLLGDAFDVWFRANQRNVALLAEDLRRTAKPVGGTRR